MRDDHLNNSSSMSPPPKRKRCASGEQKIEEMSGSIKSLNNKRENMDMTENYESDEKRK